jgi:hypothetical protein
MLGTIGIFCRHIVHYHHIYEWSSYIFSKKNRLVDTLGSEMRQMDIFYLLTRVAIFFSQDRLLGNGKVVERAEWRIYPTRNCYEIPKKERESHLEREENPSGEVAGNLMRYLLLRIAKAIRFLMLNLSICCHGPLLSWLSGWMNNERSFPLLMLLL